MQVPIGGRLYKKRLKTTELGNDLRSEYGKSFFSFANRLQGYLFHYLVLFAYN